MFFLKEEKDKIRYHHFSLVVPQFVLGGVPGAAIGQGYFDVGVLGSLTRATGLLLGQGVGRGPVHHLPTLLEAGAAKELSNVT